MSDHDDVRTSRVADFCAAQWLGFTPPLTPAPATIKSTGEPLTIVVPCHNEAQSLPYLDRTLALLSDHLAGRYKPRFVFVDDASTDETAQVLKHTFGSRGNARILTHTENRETGERSGDDDIEEAFVIYRPTGQILWALVDGAGQDSINLQIGGDVFDLLG